MQYAIKTIKYMANGLFNKSKLKLVVEYKIQTYSELRNNY